MGLKKTVELETKLNASYWNNRYLNEETGWDIGYANPVLVDFVMNNYDKSTRILIPGLGKGYELEYLWKHGYTNVFGLDVSTEARTKFLNRTPSFPADQYIIQDFFEHSDKYNLILEQTFFCALDPKLRERYAAKMNELLEPKGLLFGLLFNFNRVEGPPFGGKKDEYISLFSPDFEIVELDICKNSIVPRKGNEFFFQFRKK